MHVQRKLNTREQHNLENYESTLARGLSSLSPPTKLNFKAAAAKSLNLIFNASFNVRATIIVLVHNL